MVLTASMTHMHDEPAKRHSRSSSLGIDSFDPDSLSIPFHQFTTNNNNCTDAKSFRSTGAESTDSCKSISDPQVLLSRAVHELKVAAKDAAEYLDIWSYWRRHPFLADNIEFSGQLLFEHLIISTNTTSLNRDRRVPASFDDIASGLHAAILEWLSKAQGTVENDNVNMLREQICTAFYVMFMDDTASKAILMLEDAQRDLPAELYSSLKRQLIGNLEPVSHSSSGGRPPASDPRKLVVYAQDAWKLVQTLFLKLVSALQNHFAQFISILKQQPDAWTVFLRKVFAALVMKLRQLATFIH